MPLRDRDPRGGYLDPVILADVDEGVEVPVSLADVAAGVEVPVTFAASDFMLEVARGNIAGMSSVNKFGQSTNVDSGVSTDIWDRANATDDQAIWIAPTTARIHNIASSSASDDGDPAGVGAQTLQIYGLPDWDTAEISEIITLNGTADVATANSYVIIHRMKVLAKGATSINVGTITATAQVDGTVTAQIQPDQGQTQMAIYGIPSIQTGYMPRLYANINRSVATGSADVMFLANQTPKTELLNFQVKHTFSVSLTGTSAYDVFYSPYNGFAGPAILKVQSSGSANNLDVSAGFDLILVNN